MSLVPRFACAPQDNSYRLPYQKSPAPSANTFIFWGFQVHRGPRPILRRASVFLQNSTSLSTSGAYETGFIAEPYTKGHICMNYAQHGRSNPQTVLIISSMRNIARSKHTRCNQMVFPSRVFVEICLPKWAREDAALVCSGLAGVHFWLRGQGANGGRERERRRARGRVGRRGMLWAVLLKRSAVEGSHLLHYNNLQERERWRR